MKQLTITLSLAEVKYRSMRLLVAELAWLLRLLYELTVPSITPIPVHCDNKSTIYIAQNPIFHEKPNIELDCNLFVKN